MTYWRTLLGFLLLAAVLVGCGSSDGTATSADPSIDEAAETTTQLETTVTSTSAAVTTSETPATTEPPSQQQSFLTLAASPDLTVTVTVAEGGVSGELLEVALTNSSGGEMDFVVPCGLIFVPDTYVEPPGGGEDPPAFPDPPGEQRMINLTPFDVRLGPGDTIVVTPYVMCIDSSSAAPTEATSYDVGTMATDDLGELAACICLRDITAAIDPLLGDMSLQMAMWAASDGNLPDMDAALAQAQGALGDTLGGELGFDLEDIADLIDLEGLEIEGLDLEALLEQALGFMDDYQAGATKWLEECGIDLEN